MDEVESCEVLGVDQLGFDLRTVTLDGAQDGEVAPHLRPAYATVAPPRPSPAHLLTCSPAHLLPAPCYTDTYVHAHAPAQVRRVGFKMPPQNLEEALSLFMKLFQETYERQQGWLE